MLKTYKRFLKKARLKKKQQNNLVNKKNHCQIVYNKLQRLKNIRI